MILPTLTKTWQFNVNQELPSLGSVLDNTRQLLLALKNGLKGFASNPWTVVGSSNGTTAAMDGVDRWVTISNLVGASAGVAHSWIVLQQTGLGGTAQLCIDYVSGTHLFTVVSSFYSAFTGGTTTNRPTSTSEFSHGQPSMFDSTGGAQPYCLHLMQTTDGQHTRGFWSSAIGVMTTFMYEKPPQAPAGFSHCAGWSFGGMNAADTASFTGWFATAGGESMVAQISGWTGRCGVAFFSETIGNGVVTHTQAWVSGANLISQEFPLYRVGLFAQGHTSGGNPRGYMGYLPDMWAGSQYRRVGEQFPVGTNTFINLGPLTFPWNGTPYKQV